MTLLFQYKPYNLKNDYPCTTPTTQIQTKPTSIHIENNNSNNNNNIFTDAININIPTAAFHNNNENIESNNNDDINQTLCSHLQNGYRFTDDSSSFRNVNIIMNSSDPFANFNINIRDTSLESFDSSLSPILFSPIQNPSPITLQLCPKLSMLFNDVKNIKTKPLSTSSLSLTQGL
eukprot:Pgem_evm1s8488